MGTTKGGSTVACMTSGRSTECQLGQITEQLIIRIRNVLDLQCSFPCVCARVCMRARTGLGAWEYGILVYHGATSIKIQSLLWEPSKDSVSP